jgi:hypothetical protein
MEFYHNINHNTANSCIYTIMINRPIFIVNTLIISVFVNCFDNYTDYSNFIDIYGNKNNFERITLDEYIKLTHKLYLDGIKTNSLRCCGGLGVEIHSPILRISQLKT